MHQRTDGDVRGCDLTAAGVSKPNLRGMLLRIASSNTEGQGNHGGQAPEARTNRSAQPQSYVRTGRQGLTGNERRRTVALSRGQEAHETTVRAISTNIFSAAKSAAQTIV